MTFSSWIPPPPPAPSSYSCHVTLMLSLFQVQSAGIFELRLVSFTNSLGQTADGDCCSGVRTDGSCHSQCRTFFRVCLKHYQHEITTGSDKPCTFGHTTTPVIGNSTFQVPDIYDTFTNPITFEFDFAWPVGFSYHPIQHALTVRLHTIYKDNTLILKGF